MAFNVSAAFEQFCKNLRFSDDSLSKISYRYHAITKRINSDYWDSSSDTTHSLYVGSFGRDTEILTSDIDMLVQLPYSTYKKFDAHTSNGQSALLQEVKRVIEKTYSVTNLKADGQRCRQDLDLLTKWCANPFCGTIVIGGMQHDGTPKQTNGNAFRRYRVTDSRNPPAAEDRADGIF